MTGPTRFDARELFVALARHEVRYVTIGGIAIQAHGGQRFTRDLDIAIPLSRSNLERLAAALAEVDARVIGPDGSGSATTPTACVLDSSDQWHFITRYGPLDVITLPAHLGSFEDVFTRAHQTPLGDITVPIAHRDDLLEMKRASDRPQDAADAKLLEALKDAEGLET